MTLDFSYGGGHYLQDQIESRYMYNYSHAAPVIFDFACRCLRLPSWGLWSLSRRRLLYGPLDP